MAAAQGSSPWLAAGVGLSVGALLLLLGLAVFSFTRRKRILPEELQLEQAIAELRMSLQITAADGFLLSSERSAYRPYLHLERKKIVVIQRSFVEAAARLSLFQNFDTHQFDAFCICLRCSNGDSEREDSIPPEYCALCSWLLDICTYLIKPSLADFSHKGYGSSIHDSKCELGIEERFPYFQKICGARLWSEMGGNLFKRLRMAAQARACPHLMCGSDILFEGQLDDVMWVGGKKSCLIVK